MLFSKIERISISKYTEIVKYRIHEFPFSRVRNFAILRSSKVENLLFSEFATSQYPEVAKLQIIEIPNPTNLTKNGAPFWKAPFVHLKAFDYKFSKKSFPLSSVIINAGKSLMVILRTASMPISSKSTTSTDKMFSFAKIAAGPPIDPK